MTDRIIPDQTPDEPQDPAVGTKIGPEASNEKSAAQWALIRARFRKHKMAMIGLWVLIILYTVAIFAGFFAPFNTSSYGSQDAFHPPQIPQISTEHGLHVPVTESFTDPQTLEPTFQEHPQEVVSLGFFVQGDPYTLFGFISMDIHLFGPEDPEQRWYPLGADRAGGDLLSKIIYGSQISLSIGLVGVGVSLLLGLVLGGISGYFGGAIDNVIQRIIELLMSIPTLPLWLGLAASVPPQWGPVPTYFMITLILSLVGWTSLARVIRGRLLQTRGEDYVLAARLDGVPTKRIISRHMLPSFSSHIIATVSLAVPTMILSETALSFLGLGLQAPAVSWGVLLQDAQSVSVVANAPWLLLPGLAVVVAVVAFNFVGDGLRDSADPYGKR